MKWNDLFYSRLTFVGFVISVSASLSTLCWTKPQNCSNVSTFSTYMYICTVLCVSEPIYDSVCFQEAYKIGGGFIWAAYSNCGGIYLSLVPVGQVIRLTQQERPPAHFCQRWKNKDSIPYSGKRENYHQMGIFFISIFHLPYLSCFGYSLWG